MITCNVQLIYDEHIAGLSAGERLRLVELITRSMAEPELPKVDAAAQSLRETPGWHAGDRRGDRSEWRDRAL